MHVLKLLWVYSQYIICIRIARTAVKMCIKITRCYRNIDEKRVTFYEVSREPTVGPLVRSPESRQQQPPALGID